MRTLTRSLLVAAMAATAFGVAAPAAHACTGPVCEAICEVQASDVVVRLTGARNCIVK